jgi:methionyl aminopeptidase
MGNITIKTAEDIEGMRVAGRGRRGARLHHPLREAGRHHRRIDRLCHEYMTNVQAASRPR